MEWRGGCAPAVLAIPAAVVPCGVVFPLRHWFACRCGVRRGAEPQRHWLSLPLWCPAGGLLCLPSAYPAFSLLFCPLSPRPPSPAGKGEPQSLFRRGLRPRHPCAEPLATLARPANPAPTGDSFSASPVRCKTDRTAFLLAVPAAKERGDRGRWNHPSHATAAFEMVLSPGAGRASAAGVQPPAGWR